MFLAGVWGTLCLEDFVSGSAAVTCRQMGYRFGQLLAGATRCITDGKHLCVTSPHVAVVSCNGSELEITSCPFEYGEDVFCPAIEGVILDCVGDAESFGVPAEMPDPGLA